MQHQAERSAWHSPMAFYTQHGVALAEDQSFPASLFCPIHLGGGLPFRHLREFISHELALLLFVSFRISRPQIGSSLHFSSFLSFRVLVITLVSLTCMAQVTQYTVSLHHCHNNVTKLRYDVQCDQNVK